MILDGWIRCSRHAQAAVDIRLSTPEIVTIFCSICHDVICTIHSIELQVSFSVGDPVGSK